MRQPWVKPFSRYRSNKSKELQEIKEIMDLIEVLEKVRRFYKAIERKKFEIKVGNKIYRFKLKYFFIFFTFYR